MEAHTSTAKVCEAVTWSRPQCKYEHRNKRDYHSSEFGDSLTMLMH